MKFASVSFMNSPGARFRDPSQKLVSDVMFLTRNKTAQLRENANGTRKLFSVRDVFKHYTFLKIYGEIQIFGKIELTREC